jgi:hypothetical protein
MSQQQAPQPTGWIRLTVAGSSLTSNMIRPAIRFNGYPVPAGYGESTHPVPPGRWHVDARCQWLREYGQAELDVDVAEGQAVDVFYAPPWHQFSQGRIGLTHQQRPGLWVFVVTMLLVLLIVVGAILLSL